MPPSHRIAEQARTWVGTRFAHQGRVKKTDTHKGGVDCLGLLIGVARELNLPHAMHDDTSYGHIPDGEYLREKLSEQLTLVDIAAMQSGDVALLVIDNNPQHLAIIGEAEDEFTLIHAYAPVRAVVEHRLDDGWKAKVAAVFRLQICV